MKTTDRSKWLCAVAVMALTLGHGMPLLAGQTYTWAGGASTAWLTPTNWTPNGVPGIDDTAVISSGAPQLPGDSQPLPQIQLSGGVLGGVGTVTSSITWSGGRVDAVLTIASGATLTISGVSTAHELANGGTIHNNGTTQWTGGYLLRQATDAGTLPCSFNNAAGAVVEITADVQAYISASKAWTFNNAGTLRKTAGTGTCRIEPSAYNNTGLTEVQTGSMQLGGASSASPGAFVTATGTTLTWLSGGITSGASFTGAGEQRILGGSLSGTISATQMVITGSVGGTSSISGSVQLRSGGVVTGVMEITGAMDWQTGRVDGTLNIASGATLSITGTSAYHELANGGTVNNSGTVTWVDGYIWRLATDASVDACSFNNLAGGLFEITGNSQAYVVASKAWTFTNAGTVRKTAGTGTSRIDPTAYNSTGLTEVQTGNLQVGGASSSSSGTFEASSGAVLIWTSGGITDGASFTGVGEKRISGGSLSGTISASQMVIAGSVGGTSSVSGSVLLRNGVVTGTLEITGAMEWQGGRVDGVLNIASGATLSLTGVSAYHELADGGTVNNSGTVTWIDGYIWRLATDASVEECSINNLAGGLFNITGNNIAQISGSKAWTFTNAGTVRKSAGTGSSQILPTAYNSTGITEAKTGTLRVGGAASSSSGTFSADTGAIVVWTAGEIASGAAFTGTGEVQVNGGVLNGALTSTSLVVTGTVGGTCSIGGSAQLRGGVLSGVVDITGALDWQNGRVDGTLNIASGAALSITGNSTYHELADGGTVNNSGTLTWSNGYIWRLAADASTEACSINNLAGGVFDITGNNIAQISGSKPWSITNAGTLRKLSTGNSYISITSFTNTASTALIEVAAGVLQLGQFSQTAGTLSLHGGNVECANLQIGGGVLKGSRSVVGSVTQTGGQIQPGDSGIGTLTITGSFTQSAPGALHLELGGRTAGTQHDQLVVNGAATLGGGVSGLLVNGFLPLLAEQLTVIRYASRTGALNWPPFSAGSGRKMSPLAYTTEARLLTGLDPVQFANWAQATGLTGPDTLPDADPDHDGLTNRLEYGLYRFPQTPDIQGGTPPALTGSPARLQITYTRINDATDLDIDVEASTDIQGWETIARSHFGAPTADISGKTFSIIETPFANHTQVTVVDQFLPGPGQPRRFLRVRVTGP